MSDAANQANTGTPVDAVQGHIDAVVQDLRARVTTKGQRDVLRGECDRVDRVSGGSDAAVGRIVGRWWEGLSGDEWD